MALASAGSFTLLVRDIVCGALFLFAASPQSLVESTLSMYQRLDYGESGMDLGISRDWFVSFVRCEARLHRDVVDGEPAVNGPLICIDANGGMAKVKTVALIGSTLSDKVGELVAVKVVGKAKKALAPLGLTDAPARSRESS